MKEREDFMIRKLQETSQAQLEKMNEAKAQADDERRRKLEASYKRRVDEASERKNTDWLQNLELRDLKKKTPLYLQKEREFEELQNQLEMEKKMNSISQLKLQKGRILHDQLSEHKRLYELTKQQKQLKLVEDRYDLQM